MENSYWIWPIYDPAIEQLDWTRISWSQMALSHGVIVGIQAKIM
jgi:hypothetical protein